MKFRNEKTWDLKESARNEEEMEKRKPMDPVVKFITPNVLPLSQKQVEKERKCLW